MKSGNIFYTIIQVFKQIVNCLNWNNHQIILYLWNIYVYAVVNKIVELSRRRVVLITTHNLRPIHSYCLAVHSSPTLYLSIRSWLITTFVTFFSITFLIYSINDLPTLYLTFYFGLYTSSIIIYSLINIILNLVEN